MLLKGVVKIIKQAFWNNIGNEVIYKLETNIRGFSEEYCVHYYDLQPYKEETMEEKKLNINAKFLDCSVVEKIELALGNTHEVVVEDGKTFVVRKQPQYPKTFEDCLKILGYNIAHTIPMNHGHNGLLMMKLQRLLVCRDAYWNIAGEQMGLGKPWKPRWNDNYQRKWLINFYQDEINLTNGPNVHFVLVFPTEEMRDAFYENFKELIEECKELL